MPTLADLPVPLSIATMEAKLILASIAQRWRLELAPATTVRVHPALTLRPADGLPMIVRQREPARAKRTTSAHVGTLWKRIVSTNSPNSR